MIKQAVIPAAGLGTRFLPVTKILPKELLPIVERPALEFIIEELAESGIQEVILVLSHEKESIFTYFSEGGFIDQMLEERGHGGKLLELRKLLKRIKFKRVYQKVPLGLGDAVLCAKREITDPFFTVVLPDDLVFSKKPCLKQLIDEHSRTKKNIIAVEKVDRDQVSSYGIVGSDEKLGAKKALEEYKRMKADTSHYYIDWISMNFITQQLLNLKRTAEAEVIGENNVKEFPDKDLIMVTMGNVYLALNKKEKAIQYYKKTLEITPIYEEAKNRLKELESNN